VDAEAASDSSTGDSAAEPTGETGSSSEAGNVSAPPMGLNGQSSCAYQDDTQFCACLGANCGGNTVKDKNGVWRAVYCGHCTAPSYCAAYGSIYGGALGTCSAGGGLEADQKLKSEWMTSIGETGGVKIAYADSYNLGDNRGYTNGRAGFCTGTGDAIIVIECYDLAEPSNPFLPMMPALTKINDAFADSGGTTPQASTAGLGGWVAAWKASASDPVFDSCQDYAQDAIYYGVGVRHAAEKGFTMALTKASFYDAEIEQGEADPRFGVAAWLIPQADKMTGQLSNPPTAADEVKWESNFLAARYAIMKSTQWPETRVWNGNTGRVVTFQNMLKAGNYDMSQCIPAEGYALKTVGGTAQAIKGGSCP
jgi:chitosanase